MDKKQYKIGELAAVTKTSAKAIRIYEKKGLLSSERDRENGYRYFPESAVVTMQRIRMLKYLGFRLDDIGRMLEHYAHMDLTESFLEQKRLLEKKAKELERMIYCMDRAAKESRMEGFEIEGLFDSLQKIIISRQADEGVFRMFGHSDEPKGWSRWIFERAGLQEGEHVLDAGCGWGNLWRYNEERYAADMEVTLVDFHNTHADEMAVYIQDKPRFHFLWGDLNVLDFPEKYHCIFFNHVIPYMEDPIATYRRLKTYLRPGGRLIATWGGMLLADNLADLLCEQDISDRKKIREHQAQMKKELEQREQELRQVFGEVTLYQYPATLRFADAKEMADYLEPVAGKLGINISERMPLFESFLKKKYADTGEFRIVRDGCLYVCRA